MKYPEDCVQSFVGEWWVPDGGKAVCRGRLLWTHFVHVDQEPLALTATGRKSSTDHSAAYYKISPLLASKPSKAPPIPVAGLPYHEGEVHVVQVAKRRPVIVIANLCKEVPKHLRQGLAKWATSPTYLVAPCYGASQDGSRGGFPPRFLEQVRRAEFPQYMWDKLPNSRTLESVVRLDHLGPIGRHRSSYEVTQWRLSEGAIAILDEWLNWYLCNKLDPNETLGEFRNEMRALRSAFPDSHTS